MTEPHLNFASIGGTCATLLGVITANQQNLEWGLRCGASIIAILVGCCTLWAFFRPKHSSARSGEGKRAADSVD